jgi:HSP20 family protein
MAIAMPPPVGSQESPQLSSPACSTSVRPRTSWAVGHIVRTYTARHSLPRRTPSLEFKSISSGRVQEKWRRRGQLIARYGICEMRGWLEEVEPWITGSTKHNPGLRHFSNQRRDTMTEMTAPSRTSRHLRPFFGRDPFTALRQEVDDLLTRFTVDGPENWFSGAMTPSADLSETNEALQVKIDVPGLKPDDIDIEVAHNSLRISGERKEEKEEKGKSFHRVERRTGKFSRTISLPCAVQESKIHAEYHDGVLSILMPKAEEAKAHRVKIAAK